MIETNYFYLALKFAKALTDFMDGTKDHHIGDETGLPEEDCQRIAAARKEAYELLQGWGDKA